MSSAKSGSSQAASRYAKALFELAKEANLEAVEKDLLALKALIGSNKSLETVMHSPLISRAEKEKALVELLKKAGSQPLTQQFVAVLARNNRLPLANQIVSAFLSLLRTHRNQVVAEVISAAPLDQAQIDSISASLSGALGKEVSINVVVDKEILGGLKIKIGSEMLDNSLKSKLDRLEQAADSAGLAQVA